MGLDQRRLARLNEKTGADRSRRPIFDHGLVAANPNIASRSPSPTGAYAIAPPAAVPPAPTMAVRVPMTVRVPVPMSVTAMMLATAAAVMFAAAALLSDQDQVGEVQRLK